jgi:ABC-type branched-subunit amino acid transport system substrate-binding protein
MPIRPSRRGTTFIAFIALSIAAALGLAACGSSGDGSGSQTGAGQTDSKGSIPVVLMGDLSGTYTALGVSVQGAKATVSAINASGGIDGHQLSIVGTYDTQSTPAGGTSAAEQAVSAHPDLVMDGSSSASISTALPVFANAQIPVFDISGGADAVSPAIPLHYSLNIAANQIAKALLDEVKRIVPGVAKPRVGIVGLSAPAIDGYIAQIKPLVSAEGVDLVDIERTPVTLTSFTSQAAKMAADKLNAIITIDSVPSTVLEVPALRTAGYSGPIISTQGVSDNVSFAKINDPNYYALRTTQVVSSGSSLEKLAEKVGAGADATVSNYFSQGFAAMYSAALIYQKCGYGCSPSAFQHTAETMGDIQIPDDATFGPIKFGPGRHYGLTVAQFYKWDEAKKAAVPFGPPSELGG